MTCEIINSLPLDKKFTFIQEKKNPLYCLEDGAILYHDQVFMYCDEKQ